MFLCRCLCDDVLTPCFTSFNLCSIQETALSINVDYLVTYESHRLSAAPRSAQYMYKTDTQKPFLLYRSCLSLVVTSFYKEDVEGAQLALSFTALLVMTLVPTIARERICLRTIKHPRQYPKGSAGFTGRTDHVEKMIVDSGTSEANPSPHHSPSRS